MPFFFRWQRSSPKTKLEGETDVEYRVRAGYSEEIYELHAQPGGKVLTIPLPHYKENWYPEHNPIRHTSYVAMQGSPGLLSDAESPQTNVHRVRTRYPLCCRMKHVRPPAFVPCLASYPSTHTASRPKFCTPLVNRLFVRQNCGVHPFL